MLRRLQREFASKGDITVSRNGITEVTARHFYDTLVRGKLEVTPTLKRKGLHKGMDTMRQGSLGTMWESTIPHVLPALANL